MKKILFVALLLTSFSALEAQTSSENDSVLLYADQMPEFPGGDTARIHFLMTHLNYPDTARENGIEGLVRIQFTVQQDGKIADVKPLTKRGWGFEKEAIRVIQLMPNWVPGKQDGKPVAVRFSIPLVFKLQN